MKISIITVCKNAENTIEETLLSVLNQTYQNMEFIIIDGKSTDKTIEIINKYKNRISYFISELDSGVYNAMNKGIKVATGDIVFFLNANDTFYSKEVLDTIIKVFQKDSALLLVYGNVCYTSLSGQELYCSNYNKLFETKEPFYVQNICHQGIFYKLNCFQKYGLYDETYKVLGDYDMNLRLLVKNLVKFKFVNMIISKFQQGGLSAVSNHEDEHLRLKNKYFYLHKFLNKYFRSLYKMCSFYPGNYSLNFEH